MLTDGIEGAQRDADRANAAYAASQRAEQAQQQFAADVYDAAVEALLAVSRAKTNIDALKKLLITVARQFDSAGDDSKEMDSDDRQETANTVAHEYLLTLARNPTNIALAATRISAGVDAQLGFHARVREQFAGRVLACGHQARHWQVREGAKVADFVADPEQFGECLVCKRAIHMLAVSEPTLKRIDIDNIQLEGE